MALTDKLTAIADAIREKTGKAEKLSLLEMPQEIKSISGGGSDDLEIFLQHMCNEGDAFEETQYANLLYKIAANITNIRQPYIFSGYIYTNSFPTNTISFKNLTKISNGEQAFSEMRVSNSSYPITLSFPVLVSIEESLNCFNNINRYSNNGISFSFPELKTACNSCFNGVDFLVRQEFPKLEKGNGYSYAIFSYSKAPALILPALTELQNQLFMSSEIPIIDIGDKLVLVSSTSKYSSPTYYATKTTALIIRATTVPEIKMSAKDLFNYNCPLCGGYGGLEGYIYVPRDMIPQYEAATNWSTATGYFRAIEDYPEICGEV